MRALADARARLRKVRRAATVAAVNGWTTAVFAAAGVAGVLLGSWVSMGMGVALTVVSYNELAGAAMLRRLEPRATPRLVCNQLGFGALLVVYAVWSLIAQAGTPALAALGGSTGNPELDAMITELSTSIAYAVYGTLAAVGVIVPGLMARYYFTCGVILRRVLRETPTWIIETVRAAG